MPQFFLEGWERGGGDGSFFSNSSHDFCAILPLKKGRFSAFSSCENAVISSANFFFRGQEGKIALNALQSAKLDKNKNY